jgi:ElaB/YqjD/DUF883 family membrane-anchored ribosome-binding protein
MGMTMMGGDLSQESASALRARMQGHVAAARDELRDCGTAIRAELRPGNLVRRHPWVAAAVAGGVGLLLTQLLLRRRRAVLAAAAVPVVAATVGKGTWLAGKMAGLAFSAGRRLIVPLVAGAVSRQMTRGRR